MKLTEKLKEEVKMPYNWAEIIIVAVHIKNIASIEDYDDVQVFIKGKEKNAVGVFTQGELRNIPIILSKDISENYSLEFIIGFDK